MRLDVFMLDQHGPNGDEVIKTSGFGPRGGRNHNGVDYGTVLGQLNGAPIYAPFPGRVTHGFEDRGAGNWLWVTSPDGWLFKAFHLSRYEGAAQRTVAAGDVVGYVGNTGASSGPHLHAELWDNGRLVNPEPVFDEAFNAGRFPGTTKEWDEMATKDEIRQVVREELAALGLYVVKIDRELSGHGSDGKGTTLRDVAERTYNGTKAAATKAGADPKAFD